MIRLMTCIYADTEKCPNFSCIHAGPHEVDTTDDSCGVWDDGDITGFGDTIRVRCIKAK